MFGQRVLGLSAPMRGRTPLSCQIFLILVLVLQICAAAVSHALACRNGLAYCLAAVGDWKADKSSIYKQSVWLVVGASKSVAC